MDVTKKTLDDGKVQVTVTVPADEVKKHIDKAFKDFSRAKIPGFRQGKAPRQVIEQNFGGHEMIYAQITSDLINDITPVAIDKEDVIFIGDPDFDDSGIVADGESYTFSVTGDVKPGVKLSSFDPVEIKMPSEGATQEDIDFQINALKDYYNDFKSVDRAAKEGDFVMVKIESTADGKTMDALTNDSRLIEVGGSMMPEELSAQLAGMKPGEEKEFDFTTDFFPELSGKDIHTNVTVKEVREREVPANDDEFAKKVGFDSYDALVEEISKEVVEQKQDRLPRLKEVRCVTALSDRIEDEIPEEYVNYTREDILRNFFNQLQNQGATFDQFLAAQGITGEQFREDLDQQALEEARECLALDALFDHLDLTVTDKDIDEEFERAKTPAGTREAWEEAGRMSVIREAIRRQKATKWLVDNAIVTIDDSVPGDAKN